LYLSLIEKPVNLLFSVDQFLFEFSKKTYQQKKTGEFFQQLKERKKLSFFYGHLTKKQLVNLFDKVQKNKGYLSKNLFSLLERRLDVIIYRSGLTKTIAEARQLVKHKKILVNSKTVNVPSFLLNPGDVISVTQETGNILANQLLNNKKNKQVKNHPKIFGDFYSKFKKILDSSHDFQRTTQKQFQSKILCTLLVDFLCTRIKLRSYLNSRNFSNSQNQPSTNYTPILMLLKWKLPLVKQTESKFLLPQKKMHSLKKNQQVILYASEGSLQKKPLFWERSLINFKQRKTSWVKNQSFQMDRKNGKLQNLKQKNITIFRNNFLVFLRYLENYRKFTKLVNLNLRKYLFKRSFSKQQSFFLDSLNLRINKPLHLEVSYNLLNIIYLYSPQRLNFPFYIDLDVIKRSLR